MRLTLLSVTALGIFVPHFAQADDICLANKDTSLFADGQMAQEDRMVFQYDGVQFVPKSKEGAALFGWAYDVRMQQLLETPSYVRAADWDCESYPDFTASDTGAVSGDAATVYDVSPEACQQDLTDTRLEISDRSFTFYESSCDVASATAQGDATTYTLSCYGEGDTWEVSALVAPAGGTGINLTIDGNTTRYQACGD